MWEVEYKDSSSKKWDTEWFGTYGEAILFCLSMDVDPEMSVKDPVFVPSTKE